MNHEKKEKIKVAPTVGGAVEKKKGVRRGGCGRKSEKTGRKPEKRKTGCGENSIRSRRVQPKKIHE